MVVKWVEFRPSWAKHVKGEYEDQKDDDADGWRVRMTCETCGGYYQTVCTSGATREKISKFAVQHLHKDPFEGKSK